MGFVTTLLGRVLALSLIALIVAFVLLHISYIPVRDGKLYLKHANSTATLLREADSGMQHIKADTLAMAVYAQGFGHAQDRLWQMVKQRALVSGRMSELFGRKAIHLDKFSRSVGYRRTAALKWAGLDEETKALLQAYADGVNNYLEGVSQWQNELTALHLPPEFYAVGMKTVEPWHPVDSLAIAGMLNFYLSQNWHHDMLRDVFNELEGGELKDMAEEFAPFRGEHALNLTSILNEEEMKAEGLWSETGLQERYKSKTPHDYRSDEEVQAEEARLKAEEEEKQRAIAAEKARKEAEQRAREEAEERARREAEERARREAEERARKEEEERARRVAEEKAQREAEERAKKEAEEKARRQAEEKARREAEERSRKEEEERARKLVEEQARKEAEERAQKEEEKTRQEAEAKRLAEEKARQDAEARAKQEIDEKARKDADEKERREVEAERQRQEAEERARKETEEQTGKAAQENEGQEAAAKAREEADASRVAAEKVEQEARDKAEQEAKEKARQQEEAERLREAAEAEARQEAEERARQQAAAQRLAEEQAAAGKAAEADGSKQAENEEAGQTAGGNADQEQLEFMENEIGQEHSNNWVISGNYTKTGRPLLSSDPHMGTGLPSLWVLQHLQFKQEDGETQYAVGASTPGLPFITLGRTKHISWGITASMVDVSDLYREKIDWTKNEYEVDGEWRKLEVEEEPIKIKGEEEPAQFQVKYTHRGPVLTKTVIKNAEVLFGNPAPLKEGAGYYSLAWGGHQPGEQIVTASGQVFLKSKNLFEVKAGVQQLGTWSSAPLNFVMADTSGNIAYALLSAAPKRKNDYPYLGTAVLDGQTSKHDWEGLVDLKHLPFHINPKKGYFVTANQRVVPENSKFDYGATMASTARALRINEMIEEKLKKDHKFDAQDMVDMQQDMTDVFARYLAPAVMKITFQTIGDTTHGFTKDQKDEIRAMAELLKGWKGQMLETSVAATVYSYWNYFFHVSLFQEYTNKGKKESRAIVTEPDPDHPEKKITKQFWQLKTRFQITDSYAFSDPLQKMILAVLEDKKDELQRFNKICRGAYNDFYAGEAQCAHNVARSFLEAKLFLQKEVSPNVADWQWKYVHVNQYPNQPWSLTKLKPIWHREVPIGGNGNTPCVSKYRMNAIEKNKIFKSVHTANYKQVTEFGKDPKDDVTLMSIDTGASGNLFGGNYFNMNRDHLYGRLRTISTNFTELESNAANHKLELIPLSQKEQQNTSEDL